MVTEVGVSLEVGAVVVATPLVVAEDIEELVAFGPSVVKDEVIEVVEFALLVETSLEVVAELVAFWGSV